MISPTLILPVPALQTPEAQDFGKPKEVEEYIDRYLHRPIAHSLVQKLLHTSITPNQLTLFSGLFGISAAGFLSIGVFYPIFRLLAAGLLFIAVVFDCADGQLARAKSLHSTTGAIFDGLVDYTVCFFCFVGTSFAIVAWYQAPWLWGLGVFAIVSTVFHCALYDSVKNRYIKRLGFAYEEREENLESVRQERQKAMEEQRFFASFLLWLYEGYSRIQKAMLSKEFLQANKQEDIDTTCRTNHEQNRAEFRRLFQSRMQAWASLGIGTHLTILYLSYALSFWYPSALLGCFLIYTIPMNILCLLLFFLEKNTKSI